MINWLQILSGGAVGAVLGSFATWFLTQWSDTTRRRQEARDQLLFLIHRQRLSREQGGPGSSSRIIDYVAALPPGTVGAPKGWEDFYAFLGDVMPLLVFLPSALTRHLRQAHAAMISLHNTPARWGQPSDALGAGGEAEAQRAQKRALAEAQVGAAIVPAAKAMLEFERQA